MSFASSLQRTQPGLRTTKIITGPGFASLSTDPIVVAELDDTAPLTTGRSGEWMIDRKLAVIADVRLILLLLMFVCVFNF